MSAVGGKAAGIGRKIIGIPDKCLALDRAGQGSTDIAIRYVGTAIVAPAVVTTGVRLDGFAKEGVIGIHSGAGDPALTTHGESTGRGMALNRIGEGRSTLAGGLHRGGAPDQRQPKA
ncbi:hypothetical protein D3C75_703000 [compost metagenome]